MKANSRLIHWKWPVLCLFAVASITLSGNVAAEECPITKAAVISTAGDTNGLGSLSQAFLIPPRV